jgi:mono/diheme cytochrome c family protein
MAALFAAVLLPMWSGLGAQKQKAPERKGSATAGREIFSKYCASCHGKDGKGGGPAATALRTAPPDLTSLAKRYEGKYPRGYVSAVLNFGKSFASHGSEDMPIWGAQFRKVDPKNDPDGQRHVADLVAFLESIQEK